MEAITYIKDTFTLWLQNLEDFLDTEKYFLDAVLWITYMFAQIKSLANGYFIQLGDIQQDFC